MQLDWSTSRVKETFENWAMYEAVIRHDYMFHQGLVRSLKSIAAATPGRLKIIDLGCGDAWLAANSFRDLPVESYLGIDLSESAVERARTNLAAWGPLALVRCENFADALRQLPDNSVNLVLASNSLHHFDATGKTTVVADCFRLLSPGGVFCWVDPARDEQESREGFLTRLTHVMQHDWVGLSQDHRDRATEHVWSSDYPETESWMRQQAEAAGFEFAGRFLQDALFGAWKYVKP